MRARKGQDFNQAHKVCLPSGTSRLPHAGTARGEAGIAILGMVVVQQCEDAPRCCGALWAGGDCGRGL